MASDSGHALESLAVDGGLSNSDLCMQTQADLTGITVDRPVMRETTALGAAISAGLAMDLWEELGELVEMGREGRTIFEPKWTKEARARERRRWERAVEMSRGWVREEDEEAA